MSHYRCTLVLFFRFLDMASHGLAVGMAGVGAVLTLAMTSIVGYSVLMRYVFNTPQTWTDELVGYLMVLLVMTGVAEALRRGDHIGIDLLTSRLGRRGRRLTEIWSMAAVLVVAAVLLYSGWQMVEFSHSVGLISDGYVEAPMWIPQSSILLGMGLLILAALNRLVRIVTGLDDIDAPDGGTYEL